MKFFIKNISILCAVTVAWLFPQASQAGFVTCDGTDCSFCNLVEMGNLIVAWLIGIFFVVFAVMIFMAGWKLVSSGGNQSARDSAKSRITDALLGFVVVLVAWLVIDLLMQNMLKDSGGKIDGKLFWAEVQCLDQTPTKKP